MDIPDDDESTCRDDSLDLLDDPVVGRRHHFHQCHTKRHTDLFHCYRDDYAVDDHHHSHLASDSYARNDESLDYVAVVE